MNNQQDNLTYDEVNSDSDSDSNSNSNSNTHDTGVDGAGVNAFVVNALIDSEGSGLASSGTL
jgi:hypothetical protein